MQSIDSILFPEGAAIPTISPCDHYAGSEKLILKSLSIQTEKKGQFDITCDLEDGAQVGDENALRKRIIEIIASESNSFGYVGVRTHDYTSEHFEEDVSVVLKAVGDRLSHITVPKITCLSQAREVVQSLRKSFSDFKLKRPIPIHLLVETHGAVHDVWEIAKLPGLRGLDFGLMDFVSSHQGALGDNCMHSPGQFENSLIVRAKSKLASACLAHGIVPAHNVTPEFNDPERTFDDALRARTAFGFLRMWSIHPNQIDEILSAFTPDPNEVQKASEILEEAIKNSWAPIKHNDKLHDRASFRYYWTIVKKAHRLGLSVPQNLQKYFESGR